MKLPPRFLSLGVVAVIILQHLEDPKYLMKVSQYYMVYMDIDVPRPRSAPGDLRWMLRLDEPI